MINHSQTNVELLSPEQIEQRLAARSVVYVPLGTLEFHGPHLPIGLDGLTAHAVCTAAATRSGGAVLPTVYQGTGGEHSTYPWTIMMPSDDAIKTQLLITLRRLADMGVQRAVVLSGHFADEQRAMLRDVASQWELQESQSMKVIATSMADCTPTPIAPDHAAVFECMLLSAAHPDLVHLEKLPNVDTHPAIDPDGNPFGPHRHDPAHAIWGVFGPDPRKANLAEAEVVFEAAVNWIERLATA